MRVLLASGFFESELPSFREYSYSKELAALGHEVTLMCGDQSYIWPASRLRLPSTSPTECDNTFSTATGVKLVRRRVFFRVSDFVLYLPVLREIRSAQVVHVIEFRQGVTLLIAFIARVLGKPVVYDHEQRGDRTARWYSRLDSQFRRCLIFAGALLVDCVRHTVLANRDHFRSCTRRRVEEIFAPLGTDPQRFFYDGQERIAVRNRLGVSQDEPLAVISGKLHGAKRVVDVVKACRCAGIRLILVGSMAPGLADALATLDAGNEIVLPSADAQGLRELYNAADVAIFTTFSVSYWEAYATGLHLVVAASSFAQQVFGGDSQASLFGDPSMFRVSDEEYREEFDVAAALTPVLERLLQADRSVQRQSQMKFSAVEQGYQLSELYARLASKQNV